MGNVYAWAPITKAEEQDDGTVMVYGLVTDAGLDRDQQRMSQAWLDTAMPKWMGESANIREQHDPKRAVGVGVGMTRSDEGAFLLTAHIVDPVAVKKVQAGVLKGYSIGVKNPIIDMGKSDAPNGEVTGGDVCEVSLADRPSHPRALFTMMKADGDGELEPVDAPEVVEVAGDEDTVQMDAAETDDATKTEAPDLEKKFTAAQRKTAAKSGVAMPNGDFPIPDAGHLQAALGRLAGYTGDKGAAKAHIIKRARALGLVAKLPDDWNVSKADAIVAEVGALMPDLVKGDAATDVADATAAIAAIARLIQSEAADLAAGRLSETGDIACLLEAVSALKYFICREQDEDPADIVGDADAGDADAATTGDGGMGGAEMLTLADAATRTDPVTPPAPAEDTDVLAKADSAKVEVADMVKAAVAEATKALQDRLDSVDAQLVKALAAPAPGGPVQMRTADQLRQSRGVDVAALEKDAKELLRKADEIGNENPVLAQGYRDRAAALVGKVATI